jgi:hypothetical protein
LTGVVGDNLQVLAMESESKLQVLSSSKGGVDAGMDYEGVAAWVKSVIPGEKGQEYADKFRENYIDGDVLDSFPLGGEELTEYGVKKLHCRAILAKWAKRKGADHSNIASAPAPPPHAPAAPAFAFGAAPVALGDARERVTPSPIESEVSPRSGQALLECSLCGKMKPKKGFSKSQQSKKSKKKKCKYCVEEETGFPQIDRQYIVFCGNPGTGKSTWLNGLCGRDVFESGFSAGTGMTQALQTAEAEVTFGGREIRIVAGDTPGLKDAMTQARCGEEIRLALEKSNETGSALRLVFFFTLESGRVDPDDVCTMQTVLAAIQSPAGMTNQFGIVINKIPEDEYEYIQEEPIKKVTILDCIFPPDDTAATTTSHIHWNAFDGPMKRAAFKAQRARESGKSAPAGPTIPVGAQMEDLCDFVLQLPPMRVDAVNELEVDNLAQMREDMKAQVEDMEARAKKMLQDLLDAQHEVSKLQALRDQ